MSGSVNNVFLVGNLGADPEGATTGGGTTVANFSLATGWKTKDGEEKTDWHRIAAFGTQADSVMSYIGKGSKVCVQGRLQTRSYDDKEGVKRYVTEIIADRVTFLDSKQKDSAPPHPARGVQPKKQKDDLPF